MTLVLSGPIRDAIREHARSGAPEEVVGVLAGDRRGTKASVSRAYRTKNTADRPRTRYEIDPGEEIELLERIDAAGLECVGFYHSHPEGPTAPSETDARLAAWPGYSYVIVSLRSGTADFGSWRWDGDRFEREEVRAE
jgi:proteasome lid subunit RPN8/RPN11